MFSRVTLFNVSQLGMATLEKQKQNMVDEASPRAHQLMQKRHP